MTRRDLLASLALYGTVASRSGRATPALQVDAARLRAQIEALSIHGRPGEGTFSDGVSRIGFSDADIAGRKYVLSLMAAAGLQPYRRRRQHLRPS